MRIPHIFHHDQIFPEKPIHLSREKSHHLIQVLRLPQGNPVTLFNNKQQAFHGIIDAINKHQVTVMPSTPYQHNTESQLQITLVQSLCRGEKMDWIVQKTTELGINTIAPISSERSEVKIPAERRQKKINHWQTIAIAAAEQCKRHSIPTISPIQSINEWLDQAPTTTLITLDPQAGKSLSSLSPPQSTITLLIGPEGGFSDKELQQTQKHQATNASLGPRILRSETAAIIATGLCQALWGDLLQK